MLEGLVDPTQIAMLSRSLQEGGQSLLDTNIEDIISRNMGFALSEADRQFGAQSGQISQNLGGRGLVGSGVGGAAFGALKGGLQGQAISGVVNQASQEGVQRIGMGSNILSGLMAQRGNFANILSSLLGQLKSSSIAGAVSGQNSVNAANASNYAANIGLLSSAAKAAGPSPGGGGGGGS
jgi:hypothetical protein